MRERILSTALLTNQIALFYLGQEGFLIRHQDTFYLFDPYLSDYVDRCCSTNQVIWRRNYAPPIQPEELDFVDYVFCSHDHADHTDPDTLARLARINKKARFIVPAPIAPQLQSLGIDAAHIIPALADSPIPLPHALVHPIPAAHEVLSPDAKGRFSALGYRLQLGCISLFHGGDCCLYDGMEERLQGVNVALLPVNGRDYYRLRQDIVGNMDAREAAILSCRLNLSLLIPMHYDLYPINDLPLSMVVGQLAIHAPGIPFHCFQPGERLIFSK